MTNYINVHRYSDYESYKVLSVNDNTATVIEVKKIPTAKFDGTNNYEIFQNAEIAEVGEPFEIVKRRGYWGRWRLDTVHIPNAKKGTTVENWTELPRKNEHQAC